MSNPQRIRIRTHADIRGNFKQRPKGQDTLVELVNEDGTTTMLPDVIDAQWWVSARQGYATALLTVQAEIDVEAEVKQLYKIGPVRDLAAALNDSQRQRASLEMKITSLEVDLKAVRLELMHAYEARR